LWAAAEQAGCEPAALPLEQRLALSRFFDDSRLAALSVESAIGRRAHLPGAGSTERQLAIAEARLGLGPGSDADFAEPEVAGRNVACAALRLLWRDLGEVRSLAVRPDAHGRGLGAALVEAVVADARALGLPRIIALTREVAFFQRSGFAAEQREAIPRKVWT